MPWRWVQQRTDRQVPERHSLVMNDATTALPLKGMPDSLATPTKPTKPTKPKLGGKQVPIDGVVLEGSQSTKLW